MVLDMAELQAGDVLETLTDTKNPPILSNTVLGENSTNIHPSKRPAAPAVNDGTDSCVSKQPSLILYGLKTYFTWIEDSPRQSYFLFIFTKVQIFLLKLWYIFFGKKYDNIFIWAHLIFEIPFLKNITQPKYDKSNIFVVNLTTIHFWRGVT